MLSSDSVCLFHRPLLLLFSSYPTSANNYVKSSSSILIMQRCFHVHSGETNYKTTTNPKEIQEWHHNSTKNQLIFTTYHSLHRIMEDVEADTVYYDEAHNSVQRNFFESVKSRSNITRRKFYFTIHLNIIHHRSEV